MTGFTIDLGGDGQLELRISDDGKIADLSSSIPRDLCEVCGNQWCCNPDHQAEPSPQDAEDRNYLDDLSHHECVDRIRYNGALDGIEALTLALIKEHNEVPSGLQSAILTALEAAGNNIYGV